MGTQFSPNAEEVERERSLYGCGLGEAKRKAIRRKILNKLRNGKWDEGATAGALEEILEELL